MKFFLPLFRLVGLLAGVSALRAADYTHNVTMAVGADADIRLTVPGGHAPQGGFLPVRVRIANRSPRERTWQLEMGGLPGMAMGNMGGALRSTHSFTVPASATHEFFMLVPLPSAMGERNAGIQVQGRVQGPQVDDAQFTFGLTYGWSGVTPPLVIEPALEAPLQKILSAPLSPRISPGATRTVRGRPMPAPAYRPGNPLERVSIIDPADWPADWRMWSAFPLVMLEQSSWERLDESRRRALREWVALGGRLLLSPTATGGSAQRETFGAGEIITLAGPLVTLERGEFNAVLGQLPKANEPMASAALWDLKLADWQLAGKHSWLTAYIIIFGLLIGPVNLFIFAPAGRRHRLFLTIPAISLGAAGVLFAIIMVSDGFGGEGARRAVVVLLPEQNEAAVFQRQICRTGLLGRREFALPADVQIERQSDGVTAMDAGPVLWRKDDTASGDWFTSRTMQVHTLRRLVPTRERIELVSAPGADPVVQSTVATPLRDFVYKDDQGKIWSADSVPPGTRVKLKAGRGQAPDATVARMMVVEKWQDGTFYAFAAGPAAELIATLPAINWRDEKVLFTGRPVAAPGSPP